MIIKVFMTLFITGSPAEAKKTEVDFLLKRETDLTAIKVKAKTHIFPQDYRGLKAVSELPNVKKKNLCDVKAELFPPKPEKNLTLQAIL